jgi:hypothetical protein
MEPLIVHTLLGTKQVDLAIRCMSSLHRTSVEELHFVLHEDGSLTPDDMARLRDSFPIKSIITRKEADERVLPMLKDYKHCHEFRVNQIFGLKLFDIVLLGPPEVYYCDTDILFLAPHRGLFSKALVDADFAFSQDVRNAYTLLPWHIKPFTDIGLHSHVNAGLFSCRKASFDLAFMDHFFATFGRNHFFQHRMGGWTEQTAWAAMGTRGRSVAYDRRQICLADATFRYDPKETMAIHFVSPQRGSIVQYDHVRREEEPPRDIRFCKLPKANTVTWTIEKSLTKVMEKLSKK